MNKYVFDDMNKSNENFINLVAPILVEWMRKDGMKNEILQVEHLGESVADYIDQHCGIDYLHCYKEIDRVYGIASRVQYGTNWRTFTIRYQRDSGVKTEFEKRLNAIVNGGIYPQLTTQAYIADGKVAGLAIIMTKDLYHYVCKYRNEVREQRTGWEQNGLADFLVCDWDKIKAHGIKIRIYPEDDKK